MTINATKLNLLHSMVNQALGITGRSAPSKAENSYKKAIKTIHYILGNYPIIKNVVADPTTPLSVQERYDTSLAIFDDAANSDAPFKYQYAITNIPFSSADYFKDFDSAQQNHIFCSVVGMSGWQKNTLQEEEAAIEALWSADTYIFRHCDGLGVKHKIAATDAMFDLAATLKFEETRKQITINQIHSLMSHTTQKQTPDEEVHRLLYRFAKQPEFETSLEHPYNIYMGINQVMAYARSQRREAEFVQNIGLNQTAKNVVGLYEQKYGQHNPV